MVVKDAALLVRKRLNSVCMSACDLLYVCMRVCMYAMCMHTKNCVHMRRYIRIHVCLSMNKFVFTHNDLYIYRYIYRVRV